MFFFPFFRERCHNILTFNKLRNCYLCVISFLSSTQKIVEWTQCDCCHTFSTLYWSFSRRIMHDQGVLAKLFDVSQKVPKIVPFLNTCTIGKKFWKNFRVNIEQRNQFYAKLSDIFFFLWKTIYEKRFDCIPSIKIRKESSNELNFLPWWVEFKMNRQSGTVCTFYL